MRERHSGCGDISRDRSTDHDRVPLEPHHRGQDTVANPNKVLQDALNSSLQGTTMKRRIFLHVSITTTSSTAEAAPPTQHFLHPAKSPREAMPQQHKWRSPSGSRPSPANGHADALQLQYMQLVMLEFNGLHWPHVTVGTLVKQ
jgi:hypothetical protein